jgi:hypothetical protein
MEGAWGKSPTLGVHHSHDPRAALESPIVRPREEFGEISVISPLRIKDEASRMMKERRTC